MLLLQAASGYGAALVQSIVSLVAVCLLAWLVLRLMSRWGGVRPQGTGRIRVIERAALEPRKSLYLIAVGEQEFLLATAEGRVELISAIKTDSSVGAQIPDAVDATL